MVQPTHLGAVSYPARRVRSMRAAALFPVAFAFTIPALAADPAAAPPLGLTHASPAAQSPPTAPTSQSTSHAIKASDLMDSDVHDSSGDNIGKVEDLLIDPDSGRITAAVIAVKDFFGVRTKKAVVSIQDLKISGDRLLTTTLDRHKILAEAPAEK